MPIESCKLPNGKDGFRWGQHGTCYADRADAERQAAAAHANGYVGDISPNRSFDAEGRMRVEQSNISKAQVRPYFGREIPGNDVLGLSPDHLYMLLCSPEELEKAAPSFRNLPILEDHIHVTADALPQDMIIGSIGSNVEFHAPYLTADTIFWKASAIADIETLAKKQFSCAYAFRAEMTPGDYEGVHYDGIMRDMRGNHLALVKTGRAGTDVVVGDSSPINGAKTMTKTGVALRKTLGALFPKLAMDSACPELATATKKTLNVEALRKKILAADEALPEADRARIPGEQVDAIVDAVLGLEQADPAIEPTVVDEPPAKPDDKGEPASKADKIKALLASKLTPEEIAAVLQIVSDELPEKPEGMKPTEVKAAMDSMRADLRAAYDARIKTRDIIGDVACDSAPEIFGMALDKMGVSHAGVTQSAALEALFNLAKNQRSAAPAVVGDSGATVKQFPGLSRFGN